MNIQDVAVDLFDLLRACTECGTVHDGPIDADRSETVTEYLAEVCYVCEYCGHTNTPRVTIDLAEGEVVVENE